MLSFFSCFGPSSPDTEGLSSDTEGPSDDTIEGPSSDTIEESAYWQALPTAKLKIYTSKELMKATGNFRQDGLLDQRVYGPMFKGWVDEKTFAPAKWGCGVAVAVQRITSTNGQYRTETQSAVAFLKRLSHPNVIKLLGYCLKGKEEQFLVYEFMQKGSLDTHIFTGNLFRILFLTLVLSGFRVQDLKRPEGTRDLVRWLKPLLPHRINLKTIIMDARMDGQYSIEAAFKAAQLTLKCLGDERETRPSMKEVVEALEIIDKMKEAPKKVEDWIQSAHIN